MKIADVLINLPAPQFNNIFQYYVPESLEKDITVGQRIQVQLGKRILEAYVVGIQSNEGTLWELKPVIEILDKDPVFDEKQLELANWLADYYLCTVPLALKTIIPSSLNKKSPAMVYALFADENLPDLIKRYPEQKGLLAMLAAKKSIEIKTVLEKASYEDIETLKAEGIISLVQKYTDYRRKIGFVYRLGDISFEEIEKLKKRSPRQAQAIDYLIVNGTTDKEILDKMIPAASIKSLLKKGLINLAKKRTEITCENKELTSEQKKALDKILSASQQNIFSEFLLYGVTGSGKTEVYLQAAEVIINNGKTVIILVPEIALTSHLVEMFSRRIENMAVIHSSISASERFEQFARIKAGEVNMVLGTRSAVFAPLKNIGLIIVDEEQEGSYKQEDTPKYHAREVARKRALMESAVFVSGTATPTVETFFHAVSGKTGLLLLEKRIGEAQLPQIYIEDRRNEFKNVSHSLSPLLKEKLIKNITDGRQSILLINRRGYSPVTICRQCGNISSCPYCSVALTYHYDLDSEICHYCGFEKNITDKCMQCGSKYIQQFGYGTQKVEEEIKKIFPHAAVARLDLDVSSKKGRQKEILDKMKRKQIDVLVGTQMVAKGFDFPDVSLVGIIDIDNMLNLPDYRAAERCFQLIVQAAGRAGRGNLPGEVVIQTYNAENEIIKHAAGQDYFSFYTYEIKNRRILEYPPFKELLRIVASSNQEENAEADARKLKLLVEEIVDATEENIDILGPAPAPRYRIKDRYRYQLLIKADEFWLLNSIGKKIVTNRHEFNAKIELDINPFNMM